MTRDDTYQFTLTIVVPSWCDKETVRVAISGIVAMLWQGFAYDAEAK